jgi:hypothetical protein
VTPAAAVARAALGLTLWAVAAGSLAAAAPQPADAPAAGHAATLDTVMQALAQRKHGHVAFTEVHVLAMLQSPLESSGELLYDAPDRLEKRTLKPRAEDLVLAGNVLTVSRGGGRTHTLDLARHPEMLPWVEGIRATLAGDRDSLERFFHVELSGDLPHWRLLLVPLAADGPAGIASVRIDGSGAALRQVEIRQRDGDHSLMTIGAEIPP